MFDFLKNIFSTNHDNSNYTDYEKEDIDKYRAQYPDIQITEIKLPDLDHDKWFIIRKWLKKDGDRIFKNEPICTIESDFLTVELESYADGYIYFRQRPKAQLRAGQVICLILTKPIKS